MFVTELQKQKVSKELTLDQMWWDEGDFHEKETEGRMISL